MNYSIHMQRNSRAGFSLIELMVVISIITLVTSIAIPNYILFKIKAARVEMYYNMNTIYSLAHSYRAEHDRWPLMWPVGTYTIYSTSPVPNTSTPNTCTASYGGENQMGFKVTNCEALHYFYYIIYPSITDPAFRIAAESYKTTSSGIGSGRGNPPTSRCKKPSGYENFFMDRWEMNESKVIQPYENDIANDALKNCFS